MKISYAALNKGLESEFSKAAILYKECKEFDLKQPNYIKYLSIEKGTNFYIWNKDFDTFLQIQATIYMIGSTAISIHKKTDQFLNDFLKINLLQKNRLLCTSGSIIQATPLITINSDMTLGLNYLSIQSLANIIDSDNLDDQEIKVLDEILKDDD